MYLFSIVIFVIFTPTPIVVCSLHQLFGSCLLFGLEFTAVGNFHGNSLECTLWWRRCLGSPDTGLMSQVARRRCFWHFGTSPFGTTRHGWRWWNMIVQGTQTIVPNVTFSRSAFWTLRSTIHSHSSVDGRRSTGTTGPTAGHSTRRMWTVEGVTNLFPATRSKRRSFQWWSRRRCRADRGRSRFPRTAMRR